MLQYSLQFCQKPFFTALIVTSNVLYCCSILAKTETCRKKLAKLNTHFNENQKIGSLQESTTPSKKKKMAGHS